jgi:hypothetical protein
MPKSKSKSKLILNIKKSDKYQERFLILPVIAYTTYILLLLIAMIRQQSGNSHINIKFLMFWGILTYLMMVVISLFGFIRNHKLRLILLLINFAVSIAVIGLSISVMVLAQRDHVAEYSCNDYVRCLYN